MSLPDDPMIKNEQKILTDIQTSNLILNSYTPENFTQKEKKILLNFFTNCDKPVCVIHNLPQEVVGAMFSRYSRSSKSVRRLFLDEFWNQELGIENLKTNINNEKALERTKIFFKKVFAEYGDDSVIQMGSVHIAFEGISQIIGAKAVEDQRVASAYIEKSTRYVDFGAKLNGHYLYMEPPEITKSRFHKEFTALNNSLFASYIKYLPLVIDHLRNVYPLEKQTIQDPSTNNISKYADLLAGNKEIVRLAYERALKAKALDTIRFFLPITTITNLGAHYSGQAAELTVNKMLSSPYDEVRSFGVMAYQELIKVSPNFLQNVDHPFGVTAREYRKEVSRLSEEGSAKWNNKISSKKEESDQVAGLISFDKDADVTLSSEILFCGGKNKKSEIVAWARSVKKKEGKNFSPTLLKIIKNAVPVRNKSGRTRRQKLPRAFEHVNVEIEFCTDIGAYKDLQRNRLSTTERQRIMTDALYIPDEYLSPQLKELLKEYVGMQKKVNALNKKLEKTKSLMHAAEYVGIMGNKVRYTVKANLRQWCFFTELRTIAGGHPTYRKAMQEAAKLIIEKMPFVKDLFSNVDWTADYGLGRLKAEIYTQKELAKINNAKI
jgi:thymidylate synthase ThyX